MSGFEPDGEKVDQPEAMTKMPSSMVFRQGKLKERMASDRPRGEGQFNPDREHQDGESKPGRMLVSLVV